MIHNSKKVLVDNCPEEVIIKLKNQKMINNKLLGWSVKAKNSDFQNLKNSLPTQTQTLTCWNIFPKMRKMRKTSDLSLNIICKRKCFFCSKTSIYNMQKTSVNDLQF